MIPYRHALRVIVLARVAVPRCGASPSGAISLWAPALLALSISASLPFIIIRSFFATAPPPSPPGPINLSLEHTDNSCSTPALYGPRLLSSRINSVGAGRGYLWSQETRRLSLPRWRDWCGPDIGCSPVPPFFSFRNPTALSFHTARGDIPVISQCRGYVDRSGHHKFATADQYCRHHQTARRFCVSIYDQPCR